MERTPGGGGEVTGALSMSVIAGEFGGFGGEMAASMWALPGVSPRGCVVGEQGGDATLGADVVMTAGLVHCSEACVSASAADEGGRSPVPVAVGDRRNEVSV